MEKYHKRILRSKRVYVRDNVIPRCIFTSLIKDGILKPEDLQRIERSRASDEEQMDQILDLLPKRGSKAFSCFLNALRMDFSWVADELEKLSIHCPSATVQCINYPPLDDRTLREINKFLYKKPSLVEKWTDLARELDLEDFIYEVEFKIQRNVAAPKEAISLILKKWKAKLGKEANLGIVLNALEEIECEEVAEELKEKFG